LLVGPKVCLMRYHSRKLRKCIGDPRYLFERCFLFAEERPDAPECGRWSAAGNTGMRPCQPGCQRAEHGDSQKGDFGFCQHLGVSCNEVRVSSPMQETRSHAISFTEFTARCSNGGNGWLRFDKRRRRGFLIKRRHHVGSYLAGIKNRVSRSH
jgi:hypothetical protein